MNPHPFSKLVENVSDISPELADIWEATAVIESLGYNDHAIYEEFRLTSTRSAGELVFQMRPQVASGPHAKEQPSRGRLIRQELGSFLEKFSSTFIYALPWILMLILEYTRPRLVDVPPSLGGPLSVALMASLITSGGFIQIIARRGRFYMCLKEVSLARGICERFFLLGLATTLFFCVLGIMAGSYLRLFPGKALLLGALYYLLLSLLWMLSAMLSIQSHYWRIPAVFFSAGLVFLLLRSFAKLNSLAALFGCVLAAVIVAALIAHKGFSSQSKRAIRARMQLPRLPILFHALAPYFLYGVAYFSFIFLDRFSAGTAVNSVSGLAFGIDAQYKRGMDLALLSFLCLAGLVEFLSFKLMELCQKKAKFLGISHIRELRFVLRRAWKRHVLSIAITFCLFATASWFFFTHLKPEAATLDVLSTNILGGVGYLFLSIGLYNAIFLLSVDRLILLMRALLPALAANLVIGYTLSHAINVYYAALGLAIGAVIFAVRSSFAVRETIDHLDYAYAGA